MGVVQSLTAARMLAIEAASVIAGTVIGDNLFLTRHDGSQFDAGNVRGPAGAPRNRNYIMNARFNVNQRAFEYQTLTNAVRCFGPDRWAVWGNGQTGFTPGMFSTELATPAELPRSALNFARVDTLSHKTDPNSYVYLEQRIESVRTLSAATATVSFWAKVSGANTQKVAVQLVQSFGTGGSPSAATPAGTITANSMWTRYTMTVNIPSIAGKTIVDADSYLALQLYVVSGTNFPGVGVGIQLDRFDFWGIQLEEGSTSTALHHESYGRDLSDCQRYYWNNYLPSNPPLHSWVGAVANTATQVYFKVQFPVAMRGVPTFTGVAAPMTPAGAVTTNFSSIVSLLDSPSYGPGYWGMPLRGNGAPAGLALGNAVMITGVLHFTAEL